MSIVKHTITFSVGLSISTNLCVLEIVVLNSEPKELFHRYYKYLNIVCFNGDLIKAYQAWETSSYACLEGFYES